MDDGYSKRLGWYATVRRDLGPFHGWCPKIPIHNYHDYLVWLLWGLFTSDIYT